ncbi:MAG: hypothetical protein K0M39_09040 [Rhizobium sp.]|uniref:hypothetical protein n=1 Tax=Thiobacillus sp. TaxID=924 RepID=UPI0025F06B63|nr:hypothetical protein [Thiobacillus sp.]MBW8364687.1 hypothetical protein [Rhizobium sp.]
MDWLVRMRRLPADRMLDHLLRSGTVTQPEITRLARRLVRFYATATVESITPEAYRQSLAAWLGDNLRELASPEFGLDPHVGEALAHSQLGFLQDHADLFDARVRQGRIVEGHGDLRPEHVCLPARTSCYRLPGVQPRVPYPLRPTNWAIWRSNAPRRRRGQARHRRSGPG